MLNCPYFREQGGGMPRCAEFRENSRRSVCLPACRGRWATLAWLGGGVRSDDVGDYRTMAFIKSIAFTPSVMGFGPITAPPTQGSLFLCPGRRSVDFCCSGIVTQRAGHAPPLQGRTGLLSKNLAPAGCRLALVFFAAPGGYFSSGRGSGETTGLPSRSRRTVRPPA